MNERFSAEELDQQIEKLIGGHPGSETHAPDGDELCELVSELMLLPDGEFKRSLKSDLLDNAELPAQKDWEPVQSVEEPLPAAQLMASLVPVGFSVLPADPRSFLFSFMSHVAVIVLIASGIWVVHGPSVKRESVTTELTFLPMPVGDSMPHGGGSGGDHSPTQASHGTPPKFSEQQLTPPIIVARNLAPKLKADATVLGPPDLKLSQSNQIGDLLSSNVAIPSNGSGSGGGIGNNAGTGDGIGSGPGAGAGQGGGCCTGTFVPGTGVSAPRAIYDPDPEYSEEARKVKHQGIVVLSLIVDPAGRPTDIRIARSLGMGLDEKAIEAVQKWKFSPGVKDGYPVAVRVNIEVHFRLY